MRILISSSHFMEEYYCMIYTSFIFVVSLFTNFPKDIYRVICNFKFNLICFAISTFPLGIFFTKGNRREIFK